MKGILLAGGSGTRLKPFTDYVSKQLLPVYNKPMIMYPLSTLMMAGIKDILIISTEKDIENYENLLGNGFDLGIRIQYEVQNQPRGIAEALIIGEEFLSGSPVALILGDNMFYGTGFRSILKEARDKVLNDDVAVIFGQEVKDPERFGVIETDSAGNVLSIEEKPSEPKSNIASVGLYFFPNDCSEIADNIVPSDRGELEITDVLNRYLELESLALSKLHRGFTWYDMGLIDSLFQCSQFIERTESHSNFKIGLCEEVAYNEGFITLDQLHDTAHKYSNTDLATYIENIK